MTNPVDMSRQQSANSDHSHEPTLTVDQLKLIWQGMPEGKRVALARKIVWVILASAGLYLEATFWWNLSDILWQKIAFEALGFLVWFVGAAVSIGLFEGVYSDPKFNNFQIQVKREQLLAEYQVDLSNSLELGDLWLLNQKRLDLYHQIATNQARSSFRYAQIAAAVGFFILIGAATTVWFSHSKTTAITTGTIGIFGGSLGAYIGGTFMKVQQGAAEQLRQYFDHPLELSKILISERLIEDLPLDQRVESVQHLMRAIVGARVSPEADSTGKQTS